MSVKYVIFILPADNEGEGGVMALAALARRALVKASERRAAGVLALGALGAALFYGDSVITPAISVLSAVEGSRGHLPGVGGGGAAGVGGDPHPAVRHPAMGHRTGRGGVRPIMLLWFASLGAQARPR